MSARVQYRRRFGVEQALTELGFQTDGYDLIKAYEYLDKEVYHGIINEADNLGFPVAKHGPNPVEGSTNEWNTGLQSLEHVEYISKMFFCAKPWLIKLNQLRFA